MIIIMIIIIMIIIIMVIIIMVFISIYLSSGLFTLLNLPFLLPAPSPPWLAVPVTLHVIDMFRCQD